MSIGEGILGFNRQRLRIGIEHGFGPHCHGQIAISVTERQAYIGRVRNLAKACADAFVQTDAGGVAT